MTSRLRNALGIWHELDEEKKYDDFYDIELDREKKYNDFYDTNWMRRSTVTRCSLTRLCASRWTQWSSEWQDQHAIHTFTLVVWSSVAAMATSPLSVTAPIHEAKVAALVMRKSLST